jgi:ribA/ribD-fused uncharacterized protein
MINSFTGKYFFLSNFYERDVTYRGITYKNNEAAFQAQKTLDENVRKEFANLNPSEAKKKGRSIKLRKDWEDVKYEVMYHVCFEKFVQNPDLAKKLLATGNAHLEEGNTWGDKIWGTVNGKGQNHLGKILMRIREELQ